MEGESGGKIPGTGAPAYTLRRPAGAPIPVLIAAPHGGRAYAPSLTERMRDPAYAALRLEDRHVDRMADAIASATGAALLVAHAPRAMLDLNRATDDMDWSMVVGGAPSTTRHSAANRRARGGLGLVPRRLPVMGEIWKSRMTREDLDTRIEGIHRPYHAALAAALEDLRDRWGAVLLIDLHSMPPLRARLAGEQPGEFVIGDRFGASCGHRLVASAFEWFERARADRGPQSALCGRIRARSPRRPCAGHPRDADRGLPGELSRRPARGAERPVRRRRSHTGRARAGARGGSSRHWRRQVAVGGGVVSARPLVASQSPPEGTRKNHLVHAPGGQGSGRRCTEVHQPNPAMREARIG